MTVSLGVITDRVTPANDVADDGRVLALPRVAVAEALAGDEEDRLDAELVQHVEEPGRRAAGRAIIEGEEDHPPLGAAGDGETARESRPAPTLRSTAG